jgi:hypothetical protein
MVGYMTETGTLLETSNAQTIHLSKGNCTGTYINIKLPESAFHPAFQTMCICSEGLLSLLVNHFKLYYSKHAILVAKMYLFELYFEHLIATSVIQ